MTLTWPPLAGSISSPAAFLNVMSTAATSITSPSTAALTASITVSLGMSVKDMEVFSGNTPSSKEACTRTPAGVVPLRSPAGMFSDSTASASVWLADP